MECHAVQPLGYDAFSAALHAKFRQQRLPLNGSLEVTLRCNLRCEHCYLPFSQRGGPRRGELSLGEIQRLFGEMADMGCLWLLLTGGEPFLRRDFLKIYDEAKRKGFIVTIFTNGTLISQQAADHLAEWRPFAVEISLYGATQATYERVTGVPGSYARCRSGIELLLERNIPLQLKSVLITLNQHELADMQGLARELGVPYRFDPVINAGLDGSLHPTQYRLSAEEIVTIETRDPGRSSQWPQEFEEMREVSISSRQMYTCGAGNLSFHIDPYGRLCLCISARQPSYDLRQGSFRQGWEEFLPAMRMQEYSQDFVCDGCALRALCAQCPAMAYSEFGDFESRVPFLCQLAHLRKQAFDPLSIESLRNSNIS